MTSWYFEYPSFLKEELEKIANYLMTPGKGIIALDQNIDTLGERLEENYIINNEENRRRFRDIVVNIDDEIGQYISGIILSPEAFSDVYPNNETVVQILKRKGIVSGITLDLGVTPLIGSEGECGTVGLNGLSEICLMYKQCECHFAKWRCVYRVGDNLPSPSAIQFNAETLARFASICQSRRLVPIIEPEILPEGRHSLDRAQKIAEVVLAAVFKSLNNHHVYLEGLILKVNFVTPGMLRKFITHTCADVATTTLTVLQRTVPPATAGILFLAGGSCEDEATAYLDTINCTIGRRPWPTSYSFGRGMLSSTLKTWAGNDDNIEQAREVLMNRCKNNNLAAFGIYEVQQDALRRKTKREERKIASLKKILDAKKMKSHGYYEDIDESV